MGNMLHATGRRCCRLLNDACSQWVKKVVLCKACFPPRQHLCSTKDATVMNEEVVFQLKQHNSTCRVWLCCLRFKRLLLGPQSCWSQQESASWTVLSWIQQSVDRCSTNSGNKMELPIEKTVLFIEDYHNAPELCKWLQTKECIAELNLFTLFSLSLFFYIWKQSFLVNAFLFLVIHFHLGNVNSWHKMSGSVSQSEGPGNDPRGRTYWVRFFQGFSQSHQANAVMVPSNYALADSIVSPVRMTNAWDFNEAFFPALGGKTKRKEEQNSCMSV